MITPKFFGAGIIWWFGIVEENDDSKADDGLKLGRCRVRIMGLHSPELSEKDETGEGIAVDDLLWAYPITPITSASMNGIGDAPLGVVKGTAVFGFSFDGMPSHDLYMIGSMGGCWKEPPTQNQGFRDPTGQYPKSDHIGEEDTNRLARNENIGGTCVNTRRTNLTTGIPIAGGGSWDEPESSYNAVYPNNKVHESESGHVHEIDDTPGHERIHQWHRTGTYTEIDADGNRIHKVVGNDFEIVVKDKNLYVAGDINITVGDNANILVQGDALTRVRGNAILRADDDLQLQGRNILLLAEQKIDVACGTDFDLIAGRMNSQISLGPALIMGSNSSGGTTASGVI